MRLILICYIKCTFCYKKNKILVYFFLYLFINQKPLTFKLGITKINQKTIYSNSYLDYSMKRKTNIFIIFKIISKWTVQVNTFKK